MENRDIRFRLRKIGIGKTADSLVVPGQAESGDLYVKDKKAIEEGATGFGAFKELKDMEEIKIGEEVMVWGGHFSDWIKTSPVQEIFNSTHSYAAVAAAHKNDFIFTENDHDYVFKDKAPEDPGRVQFEHIKTGFFRTRTSFYSITKFLVKPREVECSDKEKKLPSQKPTTDSSLNAESTDM